MIANLLFPSFDAQLFNGVKAISPEGKEWDRKKRTRKWNWSTGYVTQVYITMSFNSLYLFLNKMSSKNSWLKQWWILHTKKSLYLTRTVTGGTSLPWGTVRHDSNWQQSAITIREHRRMGVEDIPHKMTLQKLYLNTTDNWHQSVLKRFGCSEGPFVFFVSTHQITAVRRSGTKLLKLGIMKWGNGGVGVKLLWLADPVSYFSLELSEERDGLVPSLSWRCFGSWLLIPPPWPLE